MTLLGTDTAAPYSVQWNTASPTALAAGDYLISATATNNAATPATATSESVTVKLQAPAPVNPPAAVCAAHAQQDVGKGADPRQVGRDHLDLPGRGLVQDRQRVARG